MANYDVKDVNGVEHSKLEESAVAALVESDQLTATCPMKKSIMPSWSTAAKFPFLTNLLDEQRKRIAVNAAQARSESGIFSQGELSDQQKIALAEEKKYKPVPASPADRFKAFFVDFLFALFKFIPTAIAAIFAVYLTASVMMSSLPAPGLSPDLKIKAKPSFAMMDSAAGFAFGSTIADTKSNVKYICLSSEKGKAVWCRAELPLAVFAIAFLLFYAWEFLALGWPLCTRFQTRGMKQYDIVLENAKDTRRELSGLSIFVSVFVCLATWQIAWIFVLIMKRSPAELLTFTRCGTVR